MNLSSGRPEAPAGALGREAISQLLSSEPPLVGEMRYPREQVQTNGVDLTIDTIWILTDSGSLGSPGSRPRLASRGTVDRESDGSYYLRSGSYVASLHERLAMPRHVMAIARPRSTLLRCGVTVETAVFDAGYRGKPEVLLLIMNPNGFRLASDAAVCQLVFFTLTEEVEGYRGLYQEE
jgi:dUTP pyrophosphatase